jgi:hypothetical protein
VGQAYSAIHSALAKGGDEAAGLLTDQREFLKSRTQKCHIPSQFPVPEPDASQIITCLKGVYTLRLNELRKRLAASGTQNGPTEPDHNAASIPPDLLATLRNDLAGDDESGDDECLEHLKENIRTTLFDLNQSQAAWLVEGVNNICLCGANNCEEFLYIRSGKGWRKIFCGTGQYLERRSTSIRGWPDLVLYSHFSAAEEIQEVYQFDGNVYKQTGCNEVWAPGCRPCTTGMRCEDGMQCTGPARPRGTRMPGDKPYSRPCAWNWRDSEQ